MPKPRILVLMFFLLLPGCAGFYRSCAVWRAENLSTNWIVVQNDYTMTPQRCWRLTNTSVTNESQSDGIYWYEQNGHLVHIAGWYNRVQVVNGDWVGAASSLGIELAKCHDGIYQ